MPGRGFTLVELLVGLAVVALLATVAYPSYRAAVHKARRADALAALMRLQAAQERHRANHPAYAGLTALGLPAASPQGHYRVAVAAADPSGYEAIASAQGDQAADAACRHLRVTVAAGQLTQASGPDTGTSNGAADNRRCWGT